MEQTNKKEVLGAHTEIYANHSKRIRTRCILQQKEETVSDNCGYYTALWSGGFLRTGKPCQRREKGENRWRSRWTLTKKKVTLEPWFSKCLLTLESF